MLYTKSVFVFWAVFATLTLLIGCDYTGYGQYPVEEDPTDGDEESAPDGDEPPVSESGSGTCADPYVYGDDGRATLIVGGGDDIGALENTLLGTDCIPAPVAARLRVDGDGEDTESESETADGDAEAADGDAEAADGDAEVADGDAEAADGDAEAADGDAEAADEDPFVPVEPDGDAEAADGDDVEAEAEEEVVDAGSYGEGAEVVIRMPLLAGDTVTVSFTPINGDFDATIYVLPASCSDSAACQWKADSGALGEAEILEFVPTAEGVYFVVMDSKEAGSSGAYEYQISLASNEGGTPPEPGKVGAACAEDADCDTAYCLSSAVLEMLLNATVDIPNGYCSNLDLFGTPCSETICNEENGGFCVNGGFMGEGYDIVIICMRPCEVNGDCRIEDDNICVDPQKWVDMGYLTPAIIEEYFGGRKACLPTDFVKVMEEEMEYTSSL